MTSQAILYSKVCRSEGLTKPSSQVMKSFQMSLAK